MKLKVKHQLKTLPNRPKLSQINELSLGVFIIKRAKEDALKSRITEIGGEIVSILRGVGVSRSRVFESMKVGAEDVSVFVITARVEDIRDIMKDISEQFDLAVPGNGKGFTIDVDGYLGAKALFIED